MRTKHSRLPVNYSIKNIIDCILSDHAPSRKLSAASKKRRYAACAAKLTGLPALRQMLTPGHLRRFGIAGADTISRVGVLPPELVIVDQRFVDMCLLPFWTIYNDAKGNVYRRFGSCVGCGWLPCCPPHSPPVQSTQYQISRSEFFIVLQTRLLHERWSTSWKFTILHQLAAEIRNLLGDEAVTGIYGSGPCEACEAQWCRMGEPCRSPDRTTASLESCGICVDRLCSDLALVSGNPAWKLRWLKHFGLPEQTPKTWKYVMGLAVRI